MHGREGEERKRARHMWTDSTPGNSVVAGDACLSSPTANSFYKDGRKISVGDCALFKPPEESPPFIGIIRFVTNSKQNKINLGVNWLYRPAEIKLGKGILPDAAPNEIFYSFHKDEISAASLLHPCKVSFLPKSAELPSGISSFVCRRVYDVTNKSLWWLTDQDYITECQEEVDQLLCKTRIEMHAAMQSGGHSPRPMNVPTATSQSKPGSESVHNNSASSFPPQIKGKKRERGERGDQVSEPIKRERSIKLEDGDSAHSRVETSWKSEVAKLKDKGGLVDFDGVEKMVQLMSLDRNDKRVDLVGRSIIAGVVAATDKFDCLNWFVQLRGLPVFDEWIQEAHKGKIGDGNGAKDSEKSVEEFLSVLLRALEKLPVDLHALQTCNIGKSVNQLRTHKNAEIQKKAKSLVDTWKKRVEAEMDAKSGSNQGVNWATRSRLQDAPRAGSRHTGLSSEAAFRSSATQLSASKASSVKLVPGEAAIIRSASASPGSTKSAQLHVPVSSNVKEAGQARYGGGSGASDASPTMMRDEKSSSSSQSHNNSQTISGDQTKTVGFHAKEDSRSSGSMTPSRVVGGSSSRHRKSNNGLPCQAPPTVQRETGSSRNSLQINPGTEKISQTSMTCDKVFDLQTAEGNGHKIVVKIPKRGRSPAQSASGGSFEDPSAVHNTSSSPVLSEKHDQLDCSMKEKNDASRANTGSDVNTESWQSNDLKDILTGSDEGDVSPSTAQEDEHSKACEDNTKRLLEVPRAASLPSGSEQKLVKAIDATYTTFNALIDSCVKYNSSRSVGDDVGMNLLASVAAGEISKSDVLQTAASPKRINPVADYSSARTDSRLKLASGDDVQDMSQAGDNTDVVHEKKGAVVDSIDNKTDGRAFSPSQDIIKRKLEQDPGTCAMDGQQAGEAGTEKGSKAEETQTATSSTVHDANVIEKKITGGGKVPWEEKAGGALKLDVSFSTKAKVEVGGIDTKPDVEGGSKRMKTEEINICLQADKKSATVMPSDCFNGRGIQGPSHSDSGKKMVSENLDEVKGEVVGEIVGKVNSSEKSKSEHSSNSGAGADQKVEPIGQRLESNEQQNDKKTSQGEAHVQLDQKLLGRGSKVNGVEADETKECNSAAADASSSAAGSQDNESKVAFDLNEGFNGDDGKYAEPNNSRAGKSSASIQLVSPMPLSASSLSSSLPTSITVAAAAKGPFLPPEDLLKSRGELGWKGSAATSAFRPAEPRKTVEAINGPPADSASAKPSRPIFDFDLNVPDERVLEDLASRCSGQVTSSVTDVTNSHVLARDEPGGSLSIRSSGGGRDLDLNRMDETSDVGNHMTSNGCRLDVRCQPVKTSSAGVFNGDASIRRDFDLNDGPLAEEVGVEPSSFWQQARNTSVPNFRINNKELGNFSSWFPQGNYPGVAIQPLLSDRGDQPFSIVAPPPGAAPQRMVAPATVANPFTPDLYRGQVLSSSPAVPFPSGQFQYPVFPFGNNFPLPSTTFSGGSATYIDSSSGGRLCFPAVHSQVLAPAGAVTSQCPRPSYMVTVPDSSVGSGGNESSRRWGRQGLDLNVGPLGPDVEGRDETSSSIASRQLSVANPQALVEEQSRIYQLSGGGILKRKEPDGGWDGYKHSWQ